MNSQTKDYYKETKETNTSTLSMSGTIQDKKSIQRSTSNSPPQVQTNTDHQENMRITTKPNTDNLKRRTYIFVTNRNILYYMLIDNSYTFDKTMIFKKTPINLEGEEAINQMNIIRLHKEDKYSFVIFVLTKKSLSIFPTEFSKTSLKAFSASEVYGLSGCFKSFGSTSTASFLARWESSSAIARAFSATNRDWLTSIFSPRRFMS